MPLLERNSRIGKELGCNSPGLTHYSHGVGDWCNGNIPQKGNLCLRSLVGSIPTPRTVLDREREGGRMDLEEQIKLISKIKNELNSRSARLFSLTISGSHLYGFSSSDSDVDIRGIFVYNTNKLLGLERPPTHLYLEIEDYDIMLDELGPAIEQIFKGNCNQLEHIMAPQIYTSPDFLLLEEIIMLNKDGLFKSYRGLATFNYKKFISTGRRNTVKKYLYVLRGLMAGIYVLEVGKIEPNLEVLNKRFKIPEAKVLLKLKREGKENEELPKDLDTGNIERVIEKLFKRIEKAYVKSKLLVPGHKDKESLNELLIEIRKKHLDT